MVEVIICVYIYDYIWNTISDLSKEKCGITIVDNGGRLDLDRLAGIGLHDFTVVTPQENLGWCRGSNRGLKELPEEASGALLLNDDVSLSKGFIAGIVAAAESHPDAVIAPVYDDVWAQQKTGYAGPAKRYVPVERERRVGFVDGTAMYIPSTLLSSIGNLDEEHFGQRGWGADMDFCLRSREFGADIIVTERSYLNHFGKGTARKVDPQYDSKASIEANTGMEKKWGSNWRDKLVL